jgi:hypothetical protein
VRLNEVDPDGTGRAEITAEESLHKWAGQHHHAFHCVHRLQIKGMICILFLNFLQFYLLLVHENYDQSLVICQKCICMCYNNISES